MDIKKTIYVTALLACLASGWYFLFTHQWIALFFGLAGLAVVFIKERYFPEV